MRRHIYISLALAAAFAAACASLRPAVPLQERQAAEVVPELEVVEGRPSSLVLGVHYPDARVGDVLQLMRGRGDGEPEAIAVVELHGDFLTLATEQQLGLSDDGVEVGQRYRYRADIVRDEVSLMSSAEVIVAWDEAPPRPEEVVVTELRSGVVEIEWRPEAPGVVFMRDVLRPDAGTRRFDASEMSAGSHVVRGMKPEGVYAFRVALGDNEQGFVRFGTPSEEVYVTIRGNEEGKR